MNTNIKTWYGFVLQQMAAESYLNQANSVQGGYATVLKLGSNNPNQFQDPYSASITATLPGATRMTASQADYFLTNYKVISHLPNTASGFSGTLMEKIDPVTGLGTGEYTLSFRSTEYFNPSQGGDWARDGLPGADGEIGNNGFAFGQIASMESYYEHLKRGESYDAVKGVWVSDPALADFSAKFGGTTPANGATLNVSGYSLTGQLAVIFKELHPEVSNACVFNGTGKGNITQLFGRVAHNDTEWRMAA